MIALALVIAMLVLLGLIAVLGLFGTLATVEICESNGTTPTITHNVSNLNIGSTDATGITPASYPLEPSTNAFEKWVRWHVSANADGNTIDNLKVWISTGSNPQANVTFKTNARESSYDGAQTYDTTNGPLATDRSATYDYTQNMPTSEPTGANMGIGGSLSGSITTTGYSDYCIFQGQVGSGATEGSSVTFTFAYDETA